MRHSNRHHGEMPQQGSADYEAVGYPAIPRAPRAAQFAPQPVYQAQLVSTNRGGAYNHSYAGPASSRVPAPAHSLSPMAMASARNGVATGGYAAQDTQEVKARPSAKAGFSILFAGAIIGGLIGAVMHARETATDAYLAASIQQVQKDTTSGANGDGTSINSIMVPSLAPLPGTAPSTGALPSLIGGSTPDKTATDKLFDDDKAGKTVKGTKTKATGKTRVATGGGGGGGVDKSASAALEEKPEKAEKPEKPSKTKKAAKGDDDGYTVASSGNEDKAEKSEKAEKPSGKKTDKADKADKNGDSDTPPKKPTKKGDADAVLRAAMGATENTL